MVKRGLSLRSTGSTGVNQTSSRSHAVLQFEVKDSEGQTVGRYVRPVALLPNSSMSIVKKSDQFTHACVCVLLSQVDLH